MKFSHILAVIVTLLTFTTACRPASDADSPPAPLSDTVDPPTQATAVAVLATTEAGDSDTPPSAPMPTAQSTTPSEEALGKLNLEQEKVEHGADADRLAFLIGSADIFPQDSIRVTDGGEALLDFGDQIIIRMFNDTEMHVVAVDYTVDASPVVNIFLRRGGFTSDFAPEGGQAVYETPGGASIAILGTEYFIAYDPETEVTSAGNFQGTVEVTSAGTTINVDEGFYVQVPANQPPGTQQPLPLQRADFDVRSRALQSPLAAVDEVRQWQLEMRWEWQNFNGDTIDTIIWSGDFVVEGDTISGEGSGGIEELVGGGNFLDHSVEFTFDIGGRVVRTAQGMPLFELEILPTNLELSMTEGPECTGTQPNPTCPGLKEYFLAVFPAIIEDFPLLDPPLTVEAAHGATATADFDEAFVVSKLSPSYKNAMSFEPSIVTVYSAAQSKID